MAVPLTANLAVEGITNRPNPESRNARKQQHTTDFLAKSNTCSGQITAIVQSLPNSSRATKELVDLTAAVVAINAWNRAAIAFRATPQVTSVKIAA